MNELPMNFFVDTDEYFQLPDDIGFYRINLMKSMVHGSVEVSTLFGNFEVYGEIVCGCVNEDSLRISSHDEKRFNDLPNIYRENIIELALNKFKKMRI